MRDGKTPIVFGDGSQTRDFTYVKDVVRALQLAMKSDYHGIVNVGTGRAYSFNQVIDILSQKLGLAVKPQYAENPIKNYVRDTLADTSGAENAIGFKAQISLEDGIDELLRYYCDCGSRC